MQCSMYAFSQGNITGKFLVLYRPQSTNCNGVNSVEVAILSFQETLFVPVYFLTSPDTSSTLRVAGG